MTGPEADESGQRGGCDELQAVQFDFWLGHWQVSWGEGEHGSNEVTKVLDGCVILERFDGRPGTELRGMSVSRYDPARGGWRQTWVDNSGNYFEYMGGMTGDRMVLEGEIEIAGRSARQRSVWHDIQSEALVWNWEVSLDGGETWEVRWQLHYSRIDGATA